MGNTKKTHSVKELFAKDKMFDKDPDCKKRDLQRKIKAYCARKERALDYFMFAFMEETGLKASEITLIEKRSGSCNSMFYFAPLKRKRNWVFSKLFKK